MTRKFTDSFKKGDRVAIIRTRHGWFDGSLTGEITFISDHMCTVTTDDDGFVEIEHPRDIRPSVEPPRRQHVWACEVTGPAKVRLPPGDGVL